MPTFSMPTPPLLSRVALDRAEDLRGDPDALKQAWPTALVLQVNARGQFPIADGRVSLIDAAKFGDFSVDAVLIARLGDTPVFAVRVTSFDGGVGDLRAAVVAIPESDAALVGAALAILNWHYAEGFSPISGAPTVPGPGGWTRIDESTGRQFFPRTDPAVIVVVHDGGVGVTAQVLLGRNATWPERRFSLLAGFVEPGESLEQCVERELHEEVGVRVHSVGYVASQPWPFPRSLMVGFEAVADPAEAFSFNDGEIAEARWFTRAEIRTALAAGDWSAEDAAADQSPLLLPGSISIARSMLEAWAAA